MSTFSAHENCPDCGEVESVKLSPRGRYTRFWCEECDYEREEDTVAIQNPYLFKTIGFADKYDSPTKVRAWYEKMKGIIPGGWDLHHIDHNSLNNDITNLIAVPKHVHALVHTSPRLYGSKAAIQALLDNLK